MLELQQHGFQVPMAGGGRAQVVGVPGGGYALAGAYGAGGGLMHSALQAAGSPRLEDHLAKHGSAGPVSAKKHKDDSLRQTKHVRRASRSYSELYARVPKTAALCVQSLLQEFLRDELRSLLKANRISYHKGGSQNLMKSKAEMAGNLLNIINDQARESPHPF